MPTLLLTTNVKIADPKAFAKEFSKFSAETLGKPESYITTCYTHNETLIFNGTFDPAFILNVQSLLNINHEANEKYSKAFFEFLNKKLGVEGDRGYVSFADPGTANMGHKGTTFKNIFK